MLLALISCAKKTSTTIQPKIANLTESVYASGVVMAENQYTVYATVSGVLQMSKVIAGQSVVTGQSLFQIQNEKALLSTDNAQLDYNMSQENNAFFKSRITEMESRVQAARDRMNLDKSIYEKYKNLQQHNVFSKVDYERVELAYQTSKSNYEVAEKQLTQLKIQLANEQSRTKNNLKLSKTNQEDYLIKSQFTGEVFDVLVKEGTLITPQTPLAIIGSKDAYVVELNVDENDMVKVKIGQVVVIQLESYKEQSFEATVDIIYPIMDVKSRTFKIEAHFVTPPTQLYPNLTAEANIIIKTKKQAMTIPRSYLIDDEYVLVNEDEKRKVKIGLSDYQNVEILEGLKVEETIYLPK